MILPALDLILSDGVVLLDLDRRFDEDDLGLSARPRWRTLIGDVARLRAGWRPNEVILDRAPILTQWSTSVPGAHGLVRLLGIVTGHPLIPDHHGVQTSPLVALDTRSRQWVRTASRFYRLGQPDQRT